MKLVTQKQGRLFGVRKETSKGEKGEVGVGDGEIDKNQKYNDMYVSPYHEMHYLM